jgi:hypothetical protein
MNLPDEVPEDLRLLAVEIEGLDDGEAAWTRTDALKVLGSLAESLVAIDSVTLFEKSPWGFAPTERAWYGDRRANELDPDFAERTQRRARQFITDHPVDDDDCLFVICFPMTKDAA